MSIERGFRGGLGAPISYAITIKAWKRGGNYEGNAAWSYASGTCRIDLAITDGKFSASNFQVTHFKYQDLAQAMQKKGLDKEETAYLEKLFRQVVADLQ